MIVLHLLLKGIVEQEGGKVKDTYPCRGFGLSELEENQYISPNSAGVKPHPYLLRYQD